MHTLIVHLYRADDLHGTDDLYRTDEDSDDDDTEYNVINCEKVS